MDRRLFEYRVYFRKKMKNVPLFTFGDFVKQDKAEVMPGSAASIDRDFVAKIALPRPADGNKGTFGSLLVWAGSPGMAGAAYMCANAACRSGVGIVHLWISRELMTPMFLSLPQAIAHPVPDDFPAAREELSALLPRMSSVVIGPGLDISETSVRDGILYMAGNAKTLVVDAGALAVIAREPDVFAPVFTQRISRGLTPAVFTPHPGEFARLVPGWQKEDREGGAKAFADAWKVVLVLKGHKTVVCTQAGECYINSTGNDGLAKGGSGDVLSGLIGSFMAQGLPPGDAAAAGVYLHGLAGEYAAKALGKRYMQPTDLFAFFTDAFRYVRWEHEQ